MLPLSYIFIFWMALMALYFVISLVSVIQMTRFGISGPMVYISTIGFSVIAGIVILATVVYGLRMDWTQTMDFTSLFSTVPPTL